MKETYRLKSYITNNNKMKYFFFIIIISALFTSCSVKDVEVGKIEGVSIKDLTKDHISLELMIPIKNNNDFSFSVSDIKMELSLNNVALGQVKKCSKLKIPANSNEVHSFDIDIKFSKLTDNPMALISSVIKNRVDLKANGFIKVRKCIFTKKYDIDENQSVKLFKKGLFQ
jgi:LEA14-like dessication related protein